ncbi:MAG: BLUF domain-containing protein [Burkholderiales bacterium]|nr:BLUF domain-containing protein [Phycisphaerae bacterium]
MRFSIAFSDQPYLSSRHDGFRGRRNFYHAKAIVTVTDNIAVKNQTSPAGAMKAVVIGPWSPARRAAAKQEIEESSPLLHQDQRKMLRPAKPPNSRLDRRWSILHADGQTFGMNMQLGQLIYVSRCTSALTSEVLSEIVARSEKSNAARNITGVLMCCGPNVIQLLEGDPAEIEVVFQKIALDPRHTNVECLLRKDARKRMFPEWGMGVADLNSRTMLNRGRLMRLVDDIRGQYDTAGLNVEARVILNDFRQQLAAAA